MSRFGTTKPQQCEEGGQKHQHDNRATDGPEHLRCSDGQTNRDSDKECDDNHAKKL